MMAGQDHVRARVRIRTPGDLAAAVPTLLGFKPENSLVALCLGGPSNALTKSMRVDMPDTDAEAHEVADLVAYHVRVEHSRSAALVAVTGDDRAARRVVDLISGRLGPTTLITALRVDGNLYWDLGQPVSVEGRPVGPSAEAEKAAAVHVLSGRPIFGSRDEMAAIFDPVAPALRRETSEAIAAVVERFNSACRARGSEAAIEELHRAAVRELDATVKAPAGFTPDTAGLLAVASGIVPIRDALVRRIERAEAREHAEAWRLTAVHTPGKASVAPYTLAAFASWLSGDGGRALVALDHVRRIDPSYNLAKLTATAVVNGVNPSVASRVVRREGPGR